MKGTYFKNNLEFGLNLKGERWKQGDLIQGQFNVKNSGNTLLEAPQLSLKLAYANIKDVRAKKEAAFETILQLNFPEISQIPVSEQITVAFELPLKEAGPISDDRCSYYVFYGLDEISNQGQLQLLVDPKSIIDAYLNIFCTFFRFVLKSKRYNGSFVEAKLAPPDSDDYKTLEHLICQLRTQNDLLEIKNSFSLKTLAKVNDSLKVKKTTFESEFQISPKDYILRKDAANQEFLLKFMEKVLEPIKAKAIYK